jgi:putative GTP pyrophosphokinase
MAWSKPEYSREDVNRAGELLLSDTSAPDELNHALTVINNWRAIHACPMQTMRMTLAARAQKQDLQMIISQRTKRIPAIRLKLREHRAKGLALKLAQMQDIGGCRAVLRTVAQVEELAQYYERATTKNSLRGGKFQRKYDYIKNPKDTGYRSIHLVYKYHSTSPRLAIYDDLKIEIQLRSRLQHYWATAVETVDFFTGQALKSNIGDVSWKRFFVVVANEFARLEKRPLVPGASANEQESRAELRSYSAQITLLEGLSAATSIVASKGAVEKVGGQLYLLELDLNSRTIQTKSFRKDQSAEAQERYLEVEKSSKDRPEKQNVLVSVDSLASLRKAYPSFYLDIGEFIKVLRRILSV